MVSFRKLITYWERLQAYAMEKYRTYLASFALINQKVLCL
jgi:hypothetical protein